MIEVKYENYPELSGRTNNPDYEAIAERLDSPLIYKGLLAISNQITETCNILDQLKKHLIYDKALKQDVVAMLIESEEQMGVKLNRVLRDPKKIDLLHGVIGMVTESSELLEQLCRMMETGDMDEVNILEEVGDSEWYKERVLEAIGKTSLDAMRVNITKLSKRYPDGYSDIMAVDRNLVVERETLESGFRTESGHTFNE